MIHFRTIDLVALIITTAICACDSKAGQAQSPVMPDFRRTELDDAAVAAARSVGQVTRERGVVFRRVDDRNLRCDLYVPAGEGPFPGVIVIHGGAWATGTRSVYIRHCHRLCREGYVVMAIDYRLAPKYRFPAQVFDAQYSVRWLRFHAKEYKLDPRRMAALGYSAGGHLACLLGTADESAFDDPDLPSELRPYSPRVDIVVAGGAVCDLDWVSRNSGKLSYWLDGTPRSNPQLYRLASPRYHVTPDDAAFFLYHGDADQIVPWACSDRMESALRGAGCQVEFKTLKHHEHWMGFLNLDVLDDVVKFLNRQWPRAGG